MESPFLVQTRNVQTNILLNGAIQLGWDYQILSDDEDVMVEVWKGDLRYRFKGEAISVNSTVASAISRDKFFTNKVLRQFTPYVTKAHRFLLSQLQEKDLQNLLDQYGKVVVKPLDENNGIGISVGLSTLADLKSAVELVRKLGNSTVLIEKQVSVIKEYRVILWQGKIIDICERQPASVTGDGKSNIRQLIESKNALRLATYHGIFEPITIDESLELNLQLQDLTFDSVPASQAHIQVRQACNLSQGGETLRVPIDKIHPAYPPLFEQIYQATWLNYCGVDLITADITQSPEASETAINELNGAPGISISYFADLREGRPYYGVGNILKQLELNPIQVFQQT